MCRECAERAERVQRVRRECAGSVSATGRRPIDGFGGNDMTISGLRRGPKGISKIKISETAEAESENTGKQTEGGGTKNDREPRPVPCRFSDGVGKTKRT